MQRFMRRLNPWRLGSKWNPIPIRQMCVSGGHSETVLPMIAEILRRGQLKSFTPKFKVNLGDRRVWVKMSAHGIHKTEQDPGGRFISINEIDSPGVIVCAYPKDMMAEWAHQTPEKWSAMEHRYTSGRVVSLGDEMLHALNRYPRELRTEDEEALGRFRSEIFHHIRKELERS